MLSEDVIRKIYDTSERGEGGASSIDHEFDLSDLVGEKVMGVREVYRVKSANPEWLDVVDFESGRTLIVGDESWQDGSTCHMYLVDNRGLDVKYSDCLFDALIRNGRCNVSQE